jgi:hypothetical protein
LEKSIKSINTGKSADIYNITIEHIINAGEQMITILLPTGKAEFKEDDPSMNPRCIGFWIASILWLVRFFIMVSMILLMTGI